MKTAFSIAESGHVATASFAMGKWRVRVSVDQRTGQVLETTTAPETATPPTTPGGRFYTDAQRATIAARRAVCEACAGAEAVGAVTVRCPHKPTCGGCSLLKIECPLNKYPQTSTTE